LFEPGTFNQRQRDEKWFHNLLQSRPREGRDCCALHLCARRNLYRIDSAHSGNSRVKSRRTARPGDHKYTGRCAGGPTGRGAAYHQGTVWSWLPGPFALAQHCVYGDAAHAHALLAGLAAHLDEACGATISEILDGNPPHTPRGCFAQAWSVSETLRAYHHLARSRTASRAGVTRFSGG
jgi:hypothetical protein